MSVLTPPLFGSPVLEFIVLVLLGAIYIGAILAVLIYAAGD